MKCSCQCLFYDCEAWSRTQTGIEVRVLMTRVGQKWGGGGGHRRLDSNGLVTVFVICTPYLSSVRSTVQGM